MTTPKDGKLIAQSINELRKSAELARHRNCIVLSGDLQWCNAISEEIVDYSQNDGSVDAWPRHQDIIKVSTNNTGVRSKTTKSIDYNLVRNYLGQEFDIVVFDCHGKFSADALGIIGGTIRAGGILVLIVPDLSHWGEDISSPLLYIKRFKSILTSEKHNICIRQNQPFTKISTQKNIVSAPISFRDQENAIEAVEKTISGQRRRPAVLISDRGRGKSAALGIAARNLLLQNTKQSIDISKSNLQIAVTGFNRQSVETVFQHAGVGNSNSTPNLKFYSADKLTSKKRKCDLLLVDEAASIPVHLLEAILKNYSRIAFASTVHGYEGTGRGFVLSFSKLLDQYTRGWKTTKLESPIRWASNDPLEALLFELLVLDADINSLEDDASCFSSLPENATVELLSRESLSQDNSLLKEVFGLLSQAHYRTKPSDLQNLLDNSENRLLRVSHCNQTIAVVHVVLEGNLESALSKSVWKNQRRPKGHLIPEILSAQLGFYEAASLKIARIVRIVVHPQRRRRGFGSMALQEIEQILAQEIDMLGTTFSVSTDTLSFWLKNQFQPVRIGLTTSANTGHRSCTLLKSFSDNADNLQTKAVRQLSNNFGIQLATDLNSLDADIAIAIIRSVDDQKLLLHNYLETLHQKEFDDLLCFAYFGRNPDGMNVTLSKVVRVILSCHDNGLDQDMEEVLVQGVLQRRPWNKANTSSLGSVKNQGTLQNITQLRNTIRISLENFNSERTSQRLMHYS